MSVAMPTPAAEGDAPAFDSVRDYVEALDGAAACCGSATWIRTGTRRPASCTG